MLAFALMGQNFLSLSVFLFSMNWSAPWPHGARENPGMLSPVQGFKQQEGAFLMTLDNIHSFPGFCNPLFIFPLMAPVLTFYPGLLVILSQAPLFLLVAESPTGQHIPSQDVVCTGSWAWRSNCGTAALQGGTKWQVLLMAWALIFLMAAGSDSPFLSHSSWHCHTYLTALSPPLSLYQILPPSFAWERTILFGGLFFILLPLIAAWQEAISCCSAPKCHLPVELESQFASILPTPFFFAWL